VVAAIRRVVAGWRGATAAAVEDERADIGHGVAPKG
jgi:hypothetical protein